ncbi:MAG: PadR family transcriptional regulator [Acidimicrobiales bacterium]
MLEIALLGILADTDLHGYEIRKRLREEGLVMNLSFGTLYPALARLERSGAVESYLQEPASAKRVRPTRTPLTGSLTGERAVAGSLLRQPTRSTRNRKVYRLTPTGQALFRELLDSDKSNSTDRRSFDIRLAFARYLPPSARLRLLERRRSRIAEDLEQARLISQETRKRAKKYATTLIEHDIESMEHDLTWLNELIETETRSRTIVSESQAAPSTAASGQARTGAKVASPIPAISPNSEVELAIQSASYLSGPANRHARPLANNQKGE